MKLYAALLTLIYVLTVAQALPADIDIRAAPATTRPQTNPVDNTKTPKEVPCDVISKYSVNWFLANVCVKPKPSTCLFYTRGLSLKAKAYAKAHKPEMTTIWEMWDASLYSLAKRPRNPLRCIMSNAAQRLEYFRNMSTAMASLCDVGATVMDASVSPTKKTFATVRQDGIWGTHEFPTLQKGAPGNTPADPPGNLLGKKVNLIEAISTDGKTSFQYWVRPGVKVKGAKREMLRGVEAREAEIVEARKTCAKLTDAEVKELDEIPW